LQLQSVLAAYSITVPPSYKVSATTVQSALAQNTPATLTNAVQSALQAAGLLVNVTVTSVAVPTLQSNGASNNSNKASYAEQSSILAPIAIAVALSFTRIV
jgi:outer membrane lipopolysaccharide assembly protein LptE/RlpB